MKAIKRLRKNTPKWSTALLGASLLACGPQGLPQDAATDWSVVDFNHPDVEGIPELALPLTEADVDCSWDKDEKKVTWKIATGSTLVLSLGAVDGALYGNATVCREDGAGSAVGTAVGRPITASDFKQIEIAEVADTGSDYTVILDFLNGRFGANNGGNAGIVLNWGDATDRRLKIRGTRNLDNFTVDKNFISTSSAKTKDIEMKASTDNIKDDITELVFSLLGGSDRFSAQGAEDNGEYDGTALTVYGGSGADFIDGGNGNDTLYGGPDNDTLAGFDGDDTLYGDEGNDKFDEGASPNGNDKFFGGAGSDTVDYGTRTSHVEVDLAAGTQDGSDLQITTLGSNVTVSNGVATLTMASHNFLSGDEIKLASCSVDALNNTHIVTDVTPTSIKFATSASDATVTSCAYTNIDEQDHVNSGLGDTDGDSIEAVHGGAGHDTLSGAAAAETLRGGSGNDTLKGGDGDDTINGDAGNDLILEVGSDPTKESGADDISGGAGTDEVSYEKRTTLDLNIDLDNVADDGATDENDNIRSDIENITGGGGDDNITGTNYSNYIRGGDGDDTLFGVAGDDTFGQRGVVREFVDVAYDDTAGSEKITVTVASHDLKAGDKFVLSGCNGTTNDADDDAVLNNTAFTVAASPTATTFEASVATSLTGDEDPYPGCVLAAVYAQEDGADTIDGGLGYDKIDYSNSGGDVQAFLDGLTHSGQSGEDDVLKNLEDVTGASGFENKLFGNSSDNVILGGSLKDQIFSLGGDDFVDTASASHTGQPSVLADDSANTIIITVLDHSYAASDSFTLSGCTTDGTNITDANLNKTHTVSAVTATTITASVTDTNTGDETFSDCTLTPGSVAANDEISCGTGQGDLLLGAGTDVGEYSNVVAYGLLTAAASSGTGATITTELTFADDDYNNMMLVVLLTAGPEYALITDSDSATKTLTATIDDNLAVDDVFLIIDPPKAGVADSDGAAGGTTTVAAADTFVATQYDTGHQICIMDQDAACWKAISGTGTTTTLTHAAFTDQVLDDDEWVVTTADGNSCEL